VAATAILAVTQNHGQVAFLAPTSILANQHYRSLIQLFAPQNTDRFFLNSGEICLLTGDTLIVKNAKLKKNCHQAK